MNPCLRTRGRGKASLGTRKILLLHRRTLTLTTWLRQILSSPLVCFNLPLTCRATCNNLNGEKEAPNPIVVPKKKPLDLNFYGLALQKLERVRTLFISLVSNVVVATTPCCPPFTPAFKFRHVTVTSICPHRTNTVLLQVLKSHPLPNVMLQVLTTRLHFLKEVATTNKADNGTRKPATTSDVISKLHGGKTNPPAYFLNLPRRLLASIVALTVCTMDALIV